MIDPKLRNWIIGCVTVIWAVNFVAGVLPNSYEPDPTINAVFMGIVGGTIALGRNDKKNGTNGNSTKEVSSPNNGNGTNAKKDTEAES